MCSLSGWTMLGEFPGTLLFNMQSDVGPRSPHCSLILRMLLLSWAPPSKQEDFRLTYHIFTFLDHSVYTFLNMSPSFVVCFYHVRGRGTERTLSTCSLLKY